MNARLNRPIRRLASAAALLCASFAAVFCVMILARTALADGMSTSLPPAPPMQAPADDDEPRRNFRMGTSDDNMRSGYDEDGNMIMEVRPRAPKSNQAPGMGPIYVFPQVYGPGGPNNPNVPTNPNVPGNPANPAIPGSPTGPATPMTPAAPLVK